MTGQPKRWWYCEMVLHSNSVNIGCSIREDLQLSIHLVDQKEL